MITTTNLLPAPPSTLDRVKVPITRLKSGFCEDYTPPSPPEVFYSSIKSDVFRVLPEGLYDSDEEYFF
jgi:hypothetical protein